jgi:16S rRNA processing protein RimM
VSDLVPIGRVGKPHGVDGSFFVEQASESDAWFREGAQLVAGDAPVTVVGSKRGSGGRRVIKLDRDVPRGTVLAVPRASLPDPPEDTYYIFQLVGLAVEEEGGRPLGIVDDVIDGPANDSLQLDNGLLLPFIEDCVRHIDVEAGRIVVAPGWADAL